MFNHINDFIGKVFTASIGEPWDFTSTAGDNVIRGRVISAQETDNHGILLLCDICEFQNKGKSISQVIAVNRYSNSQDITIKVAKDKGLGVNFVFPISGEKITTTDLSDFLDGKDEKSFIVGTFKL